MNYRLHADLVAAIVAAWTPITLGRARARRLPALAGALFWDSDGGTRPVFVASGDLARVRRLAARLGYRGPLVDREREQRPDEAARR